MTKVSWSMALLTISIFVLGCGDDGDGPTDGNTFEVAISLHSDRLYRELEVELDFSGAGRVVDLPLDGACVPRPLIEEFSVQRLVGRGYRVTMGDARGVPPRFNDSTDDETEETEEKEERQEKAEGSSVGPTLDDPDGATVVRQNVRIFDCLASFSTPFDPTSVRVITTRAIELGEPGAVFGPSVGVAKVSPGNYPLTTTTLPPGDVNEFDVTIGITSASGTLGAVQFDASYNGSGGWKGVGGGAYCRFAVDTGLKTCNDKGGGELSCAFVDVDGFPTPTDLVTCRLRAIGDVNVDLFDVRAADASMPDLTPAFADVAVTNLSPVDDPGDPNAVLRLE